METNWTPWPWTIDMAKTGVVVSVGPETWEGGAVAQVFARDRIYGLGGRAIDVKDNERGMANARLIAAAPELAEALMAAVAWVVGDDGHPDQQCPESKRPAWCKAAIDALKAAGAEVQP